MQMDTKKTLNLCSHELLAVVDFVKWIDACDSSAAKQMEHPFAGVALAATHSELFALVRDEIGWMLAMHPQEGPWLTHLPWHSAYMGFGEGLVLLTEPFELMDETVPQIALQVFVPEVALVELLNAQTLLGFGHATPTPAADDYHVTRVNRLIPLFTKARYEAERRTAVPATAQRLFAR
ncbi:MULTISPECIES: hypothetical protein [Cupriavidus]